MERDFMGLNSKEPSAVLKEEIHDQAFSKVLQWPFLKKLSVPSHSMTHKVAEEDWGKRIGSNPYASSGFMTMSAADVFDLSQKRSVAEIQRISNLDQQIGTHVSMAANIFNVQHGGRRSHHDLKMFPGSNQRVSASTCNNALSRSHIATAGQHQALGNMKQQFLASIPAVDQNTTFPAISKWNSFTSEAPAQLTIFYAGSVIVFDKISPEKAQAIMLLAGNGPSTTADKEQSIAQAHAPNSKATATDAALGSQNVDTPPSSSSPISVSSHPDPQSGTESSCSDELTGAISTGVSTAPVSKLVSSNVVVSMGPVAAKTMMPSAVPQFRKASLARFLEKRKERVMKMAPYSLGMKEKHSSALEPKCDGMVLSTAAGASSM